MTHQPDDLTSEPQFELPPPSPATLLPPRTKLKGSFADRFGDDRTAVPKALGYTFMLVPFLAIVSSVVGSMGLHLTGGRLILFVVAATTLLAVAFFRAVLLLAGAPARGLLRFVAPDGSTTPYQRTFSHIEALAVRGQVDEALVAYEAEVSAAPGDVEVLALAADLYLLHKRQPARAADLLRLIRKAPNAPPAKILYASQRLVDLYLGPLNDKGRAIVELRMMVDRFPGSPAAGFAREGLDRLKREHHGEP